MLSLTHEAAFGNSPQFDLVIDLLNRLESVTSYAERTEILEDAEAQFEMLDVRDHAVRVAEAARDLAVHCGFGTEYSNELYNVTRWHDVGKLFTPVEFLRKNGRPTDAEFDVIKEHARHGHELLGRTASDFALNVAKYHHERYDGAGYNKLAAENIPVEARLVEVADVYDALRSKRDYKDEMSEENTLRRMVIIQTQGAGVMFDPYFLRRFVEMKLEQDYRKEIGPESRELLEAFVASPVMSEVNALEDRSRLEGWEIGKGGVRKQKLLDPETDYVKLVEVRDFKGDTTFRLNAPAAKPEATADNDNDYQAPKPRW